MSAKKPQQTLADYVTIALSPLLIMALVGSLVFFLLEVFYVGQYSGRLQWTFFWFVFAMVLVARIAIELGSERATLYGLVMAGAVFFALQAYVDYSSSNSVAPFSWAINLFLIALIWWCAHQLTWDCTYIDDDVDASGKGVLEAAGLDETPGAAPTDEREKEFVEDDDAPAFKGQFGLFAWWDRYRRYRAEQLRKPHTPGVWVVYFSLAALPLFGLGQALIPAEEGDRRRYVFWLMVCYVGSGLGLLMTTSFLGLRRYLRQRKLRMPLAMAGMWMALGGGLIAVLMLMGALLPRPYGEYQIFDWVPLGSKERNASEYAQLRDGAGKGQGPSSTDTSKDDQEAQDGSGNKAGEKGEGRSNAKSSGGQSGQGGSGSSNTQGNQQGRGSNNRSGERDSSTSGSRPNNSDNRQGQRGKERSNESARGPNAKEQEAKKENEQAHDKTGGSAGSPARGGNSQGRPGQRPSPNTSRPSANNPISGLFAKLGWLGTVLKWIVFTVLALIVVFLVLKKGLQFLANFTTWARRLLEALRAWWEGLFGGGSGVAEPEAEAGGETQVVRPRPFSAFQNPFVDGSAERLSPNEITRYSFEAFQAWAWERGLGRQPEETPFEFTERVVEDVPALDTEAKQLAALYARAAYARGRLTSASLGPLRQFWQRLETVDEKQLSA
jgi:hypothetical protein